MTPPRFRTACLALLALAGCDSTTVVTGADGVFRTEGTDYPNAAVVLAGGEIVVGALVEGVIAPADGTIGYPAVVRFSGDDTEAAVYDDGERDYYGVDGVAPLGSGLAIAIGSEAGAGVYRTDRRGRGADLLLRLDDARFLPEGALHASPDGLVLAVYSSEAEGPHVYGLSASGDVRWTYRLPEAQDVRALDVTPAGDVYVVGPGRRGAAAVVARLSPDGTERWRRELADVIVPVSIAVTEAGAVVLGEGPDYAGVRAARLDDDGDVRWIRTLSESRDARPAEVAVLGDGTVAVALSVDDGDYRTGNVARLAVLDGDGAARGTVTIGRPTERTTFVQGLVALPDGRLGVVSAVGPKQLGGYGGDDFDIEVARLDLAD